MAQIKSINQQYHICSQTNIILSTFVQTQTVSSRLGKRNNLNILEMRWLFVMSIHLVVHIIMIIMMMIIMHLHDVFSASC